MNGATGTADVRLPLDAGDLERRALQPVGEPARRLFVELARLAHAASRPARSRVPSRRAAPRRRRAAPRTTSGSNVASEIPPRGRAERHPLALTLDDEARRDRLDAAGGEPGHDLLPEHRRHLVAVEPVEDPPRLLCVDEPLVDLARLLERLLDRVAGDLVEDHPPDRHLRLQHLEQVPGDRLALAIFVRREQELVGAGELLLQLARLSSSCRGRRRRAARTRARRRRRGAPTTRPCTPRGSRRRCRAGRECGRRKTPRRSPARGSRQSSAPSQETRR